MFWGHVEDGSGALQLRGGALRSHQVWKSMPSPFSGLLILDYGHSGYDSGGQPRSDAARGAFARYAEFVTSQSKPYLRWVEVWNEWNLVAPAERERGDGNPKSYVDLARTTYQRLKAAHPEIRVLTGSSGDDVPDWPWMRQAIGHGLLAERALNAEMDHHLSGDEEAGNGRNGYGRKTVLTETAKLELEILRDRRATFARS